MAAVVVIPARLGSTRFPAKILASKTGKPLVQHVVDQARLCRRISLVMVATDDASVVEALRPFGTTCVLTDPHHPSGTDRVAEAARARSEQIIVNVQADEPEIEPQTIDALVERLEAASEDMATAATPFPAAANPADANLVKVIVDVNGRAIYFSRLPIPYCRDAADAGRVAYSLHLGVYAYRRDFLLELASWPPTPCETAEKLEQLRVLEHGRSIGVVFVDRATHGIDTAPQYAEFVKRYLAAGLAPPVQRVNSPATPLDARGKPRR